MIQLTMIWFHTQSNTFSYPLHQHVPTLFHQKYSMDSRRCGLYFETNNFCRSLFMLKLENNELVRSRIKYFDLGKYFIINRISL